VIGFGRGGLRDTVIPGETGLFFETQSAEALMSAVEEFQRWRRHFDPADALNNVQRFAPEHFDRGFMKKVIELRPDLPYELPEEAPPVPVRAVEYA
jgi:hypothetical protein